MTKAEKYRLLLKEEIRQAGQWLTDNAEYMVGNIEAITDYRITINLKNGDEIPTIRFEQENIFFDYSRWEEE